MKYEVFTHAIDNIKTKVCKTIITLILLAFGISASAQHLKPPKTYWQSFGYQKQPDHIKRAYYKSDRSTRPIVLPSEDWFLTRLCMPMAPKAEALKWI